MRRIKGKLTYANVMSTMAVFLLLGGGAAFAGTKLGKNSVGTKQIKKGAVTAAKIKSGSITGTQIKSGSLTGTQVNASTLGTVPTAQTANSLPAPEAWHEVGTSGQPGFMNSWTNLTIGAIHDENVAFYKDHEGNVHLRGAVAGGTGFIFTLPAGFRPGSGTFIRVPVACTNGTSCEKGSSGLDIVGSNFPIPADDGVLIPPAGATQVWLDGIIFRAAS
ncbi:MAG: hypothetical protein WB507_11665 [Solirubrobacterales bacterium]